MKKGLKFLNTNWEFKADNPASIAMAGGVLFLLVGLVIGGLNGLPIVAFGICLIVLGAVLHEDWLKTVG